ncbi:hypothetical protein K438DRAFT_1998538 [Mycena galopus ATCC 62051]|nr:hypothetical protein K438DRAFT_1998538 [Mycena galopus ATCC 62051]
MSSTSSSISGFSSTPSSQPSSPPLASSPAAATTKHHTNVGVIAGGVVAGTIAILGAFLTGWCVRRRRASSAEGASRIDLTSDKVHPGASPVGATHIAETTAPDARALGSEEKTEMTRAVPFALFANGSNASLTLRSDP